MRIIAYHGTDKTFDKFDKSYIYTDYAELGYGFYFTTDEITAFDYGSNILKVKLTINKPFRLTKSSYNWLARGLKQDTINKTPDIEDLIELISWDTLRATDILEESYDAVIVEGQIVVFNPEQIEILERIEETMSIKQLLEKIEEFEDVQVLNQKELINELYKSKIVYRITYDANKDWFLIATAYNHTHEELLYDAAPVYGLNFNQMVDYYNDHYADLFDLIYTPKVEDIKLGFDHNNIAYIFDKFGTIYTKGQELSKNLLNDLTDRFGEANIKRLEESLQENLTKLEFNPKEQYLINKYGKKNEEFTNSTGMSYYDEIINKPEYFKKKGRYISKIKMSPVKYIETCVNGFINNGSSTNYDELYNSRSADREDIENYKEIIKNGKMDTPVLHYDLNKDNYYFDQEGIHRAIAAKELGIDFIPVYLCVSSNSLDESSITGFLAKMITKLNNKKSVIRENVSSWLAQTPTAGAKTIKIQEIQKEIEKLNDLKAELGKEISIISNKYFKKYHRWVPSEEWTPKDRNTQENNHKRQAEIDKQIEELKSDLKVVKDYFPPIQKKLFESNINDNFWKWFGDSITVDKDGNPLIFYHGTRSDFTEFKTNYADNLVFFSYKKDFADRWGKEKRDYSNEISNDIFDKQDEFKRKLYKEYQAKYGEDFYDNDEYRKELNKELDDNLAKLEKEKNVHSRTLGCYLKVHKIFYPEKDYELVLDEICKYYGWQNPNTKEYEEKLKRFEDEYDKANEYWNQWWANNKDADEETIKAEEKKLDNAFKRYSVCKSIKTEFEDNLNRIKKGAWVYFEHGNVIDKIWSLGYDAIQLSERDGEQTTLAVRTGNNQIKSVDNNGTWSKTSENIYEHLNRMFEELL